MKRAIQLFLFLILIIVIFIFYKEYFQEEQTAKIIETIDIDKSINQSNDTGNSLIKNLKYEISIRENNDYQIKSEFSEITYKDGNELVLMKNVTAIITDKKNISLFITSDEAKYNNNNYNTKFENNVEIRYLNNIIYAEKMFLDIVNNSISINEKIVYKGPLGILEADNIKINLITKKIDISMNNTNENIVIISNK